MAETDKAHKERKFIEALEAFQLLCKQLDRHAGELLETFREKQKE